MRAEQAAVLTEEFSEQWIGQRRQVADRAHANALEAERGGRAATWELGQRQGRQESRFLARGDYDQAARFAQLGGDLGDQLAAGHPDTEVQAAARLDLVPESEGNRLRRPHQRFLAGQVQVGLVQRDRLDERRVAVEDPEDRLRGLAIGGEVAGHEDRGGAEAAGPAEGHRRPHPEGARLVRGGGHHAAFPGHPGAANNHRLPTKLGAAQLFHRGVEGIEVDVHDHSGHGRQSSPARPPL